MEAWFVVASGSWAPSTIRQTCAVVDPCRPDVVRYFDIACVWVNGRFWFLATAIDVATKQVVGRAFADHMRANLVIKALHAASGGDGTESGLG